MAFSQLWRKVKEFFRAFFRRPEEQGDGARGRIVSDTIADGMRASGFVTHDVSGVTIDASRPKPRSADEARLERALAPDVADEVIGDLEELFNREEQEGRLNAIAKRRARVNEVLARHRSAEHFLDAIVLMLCWAVVIVSIYWAVQGYQ